MKNKKLFTFGLVSALCLPFTAVAFTGCTNDDDLSVKTKDVYALSAVSSVSYLAGLEADTLVLSSDDSNAQFSQLLNSTATSRPSTLTDNDIAGVQNCLTMFDQIIQNNGIKQTTALNTETDAKVSDYTFVMSITLPNANGGNDIFKMYFNETESETEVEIDDLKEEVEVSTRLEGIMLFGNAEFEVYGEKEVETEGNETETSIEFTTKSKTNPDNYVKVSQSVENNEVEYEYEIYENGQKVQETELELETKKGKTELEFQLKDKTSGALQDTTYKILKGTNSTTFKVKFEKNNVQDSFTIELVQNGQKFTYSNGYSEIL
ncbi:MAG: hypothetical protein IJZ29_05500 [Clostridia bacterium]|nr:hypothetical protein [Clostridia bacterium]